MATNEDKPVKWKDDPRRVLLQNLIEDGTIAPTMKPEEVWKSRNEFHMMDKKLFKTRLAGLRKVVANMNDPDKPKKMTKAEKKKAAWNKHNEVRKKLRDDIWKGAIGFDVSPKDAWEMRPEYKKMDLDLFRSRLEGMRTIVREGVERANKDIAALKHDRQLFPRPQLNARGEPQWVGSDASFLLELDIESGVNKNFASPADFHASRLQYQLFPLAVFRGHVYQEIKTQKWRLQWVDGKKEYALVPEPHVENN